MDIFDIQDVGDGIREQAVHVAKNDSTVTARICLSLLALMESDTDTGRAIASWNGKVLVDALPLRVAGGLHHLHLTGADERMNGIYNGQITNQNAVDTVVTAVVRDHDAAMLHWFDSPPQTNEAGRSANFMAGLKWLSARGLPSRFEMNEIGASAGINTMMERYHYDLGGVMAGPQTSLMQIKPEWRGPPPPDAPIEIVSIHGCDQNPIDLSDADAAVRVKSYVWPDMLQRLARMDAAIALATEKRPDVVQMDAADWVEQQLSAPQKEGVTRVIHHSIVWQYIVEDGQTRIAKAIEAAAARATTQRPLVWMMLETNRATFRHELTVRYWNDGANDGTLHLLANAHAHGAWVEWLG